MVIDMMTEKYSAVVFDLDGTLLDTLEDLQGSVNYAMRLCGFPEHSLEDIRRFVGNGIRNLLERSVPDGAQNPLFEKAMEAFRQHYAIHCNDKTKPYPSVIPLMKKLKEHGIKIGIVSNKADFGVKTLTDIYFKGIADAVVGQRDGIEKKPAPDMVLLALKEMGADREKTVYIGDSEVDLATAHNTGLPCISVSWGFRTAEFIREQGAQVIVATPQELEQMLLEK